MTNVQIGDRYALIGRFGLLDLGKVSAFIREQSETEKPDLAAWERLLPLLDIQPDEKVRMRHGTRFDQVLQSETFRFEDTALGLNVIQLTSTELWGKLTPAARFFTEHLDLDSVD